MEKKIDHLENRLVKNPLSKSAAAGTIGRTLGNFINQGDLGALAGSSLAKYFGHGDYKVKSNSLIGAPATGAKFQGDGKRGTRITEREYLGDILAGTLDGSATVFDSSVYDLNPTDSATFPWLSRLAHLYDQWEPNGIVFEFVSTSSEYNGSSQALGALIMATDYDPYDAAYTSKQSMENADYSCSTKPANGLLHGIECDPRERPTPLLYTSTNNGAPLTSTSLGRFQVATQGCSVSGVSLGELWISYDITFYKKQLVDEADLDVPFYSAGGTAVVGVGYFAAPSYVINQTIDVFQIIGTGSQMRFHNTTPGFRYQVTYYIVNADVGDVGQLAAWTVLNGTIVSTVQSYNSTLNTITTSWILLATAADMSFTTNLDVVTDISYRLGAAQVPATYVL
jgi:hypothetical protein